MAGRTATTGVSVVTALALSVAGYAWADAADLAPGPLTTRPPVAAPAASPAPEPAVSAPPAPVPAPATETGSGAGGVAGDADLLDPAAAPVPDPAVLAAELAPLLADEALGPDPTLSVRDLVTGTELVSLSSSTPVEPASSAKIVTAAAALRTLGADRRLSTEVGWLPAADRASGVPAVVLVGGGDLLLAPGAGDEDATSGRVGLGDLAREAVLALTEGEQPLLPAGTPRVDVLVDDSLLGAPQTLPRSAGDAFYAATPSSLAVDAGRLGRGRGRDPAPAATAGAVFAAALDAALTDVLGAAAPARVTAQVRTTPVPVTTVLAEGRSAPVADVLAYALVTSDNTVADAVAGLVALERGRPTALTEAARVVVEVVEEDVVDLGPTTLSDGSGLGDGSLATTSALTALLAAAAAAPADDDLHLLPSLLPVAGLEGTLAGRFTRDDGSAAGRGVVRAKTGTLTGTTALAGVTTTGSGRGVAFALLSDTVPAGGTDPGRAAVDRVVAAIASCC